MQFIQHTIYKVWTNLRNQSFQISMIDIDSKIFTFFSMHSTIKIKFIIKHRNKLNNLIQSKPISTQSYTFTIPDSPTIIHNPMSQNNIIKIIVQIKCNSFNCGAKIKLIIQFIQTRKLSSLYLYSPKTFTPH